MSDQEVRGIDKAVAVAGSQKALGLLIGSSQQLVASWQKQGYVPLERVVEIETATGVPRVELVKPVIVELLTQASF